MSLAECNPLLDVVGALAGYVTVLLNVVGVVFILWKSFAKCSRHLVECLRFYSISVVIDFWRILQTLQYKSARRHN